MKTIVKKYNDLLKDYLAKHANQQPLFANVKIKWNDEPGGDAHKDTIALFEYDMEEVTKEDDEEILFYVSSPSELITLFDTNSGADFTVVDIISFA